MKGIVFTEFLEMVEEKFSFETVDTIIENAELPSGGAYTSVGTYDTKELFSLIIELNKVSDIPIPDLMKVYGEHLFGRFATHYPAFFEHVNDAFTFLESVHMHIHKEVLKLYPDAELPHFDTKRVGENVLTMHYKSERRMGPFGHGLILGCLAHFNETATVESKQLDETGAQVLFTITKE